MARKVIPNKKKKKSKKSKPLRSVILAFLATCFVIYFAVTLIETSFKIGETNDKIKQAKSQLEKIQADNEYTENLLENADENDIVERIARERLGYVFPDEKIYYDVN